MSSTYRFSSNTMRFRASKIRELMKYAVQPGIISFAGGMPDPSAFPFETVKQVINSWEDQSAWSAMQYGPTSGYPPLIGQLRTRMETMKKIRMEGQGLMMTTGAQQALFLAGMVLINSNDLVLVEEPSFIGGMASFTANGAILSGINLQHDGLDIDQLKQRLTEIEDSGNAAAFLYTIPNFQNPSGVTMSNKKRDQIYQLSLERNLPIIEDDPYGDLFFEGKIDDYSPIKARGNEAPIIYINSFSKILCPGFRLGWMVADEELIEKCTLAKQPVDACSSSFGQVIAYDFLANSRIDDYIGSMRSQYKQKRDCMLAAISISFPENVTVTDPHGGFFIYCTLPEPVTASALFTRCIEQKVAFVTGEPFHVDKRDGDRYIRLAYSTASCDQIKKGIEIIGKSIKQML